MVLKRPLYVMYREYKQDYLVNQRYKKQIHIHCWNCSKKRNHIEQQTKIETLIRPVLCDRYIQQYLYEIDLSE